MPENEIVNGEVVTPEMLNELSDNRGEDEGNE